MPVSVPNLITILRILLVPLAVWCLISGYFAGAFLTFIIAGVSDGVDGYIARRFQLQSELGAYLDPLADKVLLVSIYVTLAVLGHMPDWLAISVVTRDLLIVGAVMLAWVMNRPVTVQPLWISKVNTVAQIAYAGVSLMLLAIDRHWDQTLWYGAAGVGVLTALSGLSYLQAWVAHMAGAAVVTGVERGGREKP